MHPLRALAVPALVLLLCGCQGDDPRPAPKQAKQQEEEAIRSEVVPSEPRPAPTAKRSDLPPLFRKLGLSDEQLKDFAKVRARYDAKVKELEDKIKAAREEEGAEVEKLLTDTQRARLKELRLGGPAKAP